MAKRPDDPSGHAPDVDSGESPTAGQSRRGRLATLLDQCTAAQAEAESLGEKLIAYLLAMAVEEARETVRKTDDPLGPAN